MKWYYKSKLKKQVIRLSLIAVLVCVVVIPSLIRIFSGKSVDSGNRNVMTSPPQETVFLVEQTPTVSGDYTVVPVTTPKSTNIPLPTELLTPSISPTVSPTPIPTDTPTPTPTSTPTPSPTPTPTLKPTPTHTPTPTPTPTPKPTNKPTDAGSKKKESITVQYKNASYVSHAYSIAPVFKITNQGSTDVKLKDIEIRYYYTKEGSEGQTFWCNDFLIDGVEMDSSQVYGSFIKLKTPKKEADHYLSVGFYEKAGVLKPGKSAEIRVEFSKNDGSLYIQEGDYSYNLVSNRFINWDHITVYVSGKLVYGKEP